jgi:hypothetical protein
MRKVSVLAVTSWLVAAALSASVHAATTPPNCPTGATRVLHVASVAGLSRALSHARPGDEIQLVQRVYLGRFTLSRSGTSARHVVVCGSRGAVLDGGSERTGYTLHLDGAHWVDLLGFTIRHAQKGVVVDAGQHVTLRSVAVHDVGYAAVDLRRDTTYASIVAGRIYNTGRVYPKYGEGVYVGSARNNWCSQTDCQPDRTNHTTVTGNVIGPGVTAEEVDVKEGTTSGLVADNYFDGRSMVSTVAQSWVDIKGNSWVIRHNTGRNSASNGFSVTLAVPGWGNRNVFLDNHAVVNATGYGFKIARGVIGDVVYTSNIVQNARAGACNVPEQR